MLNCSFMNENFKYDVNKVWVISITSFNASRISKYISNQYQASLRFNQVSKIYVLSILINKIERSNLRRNTNVGSSTIVPGSSTIVPVVPKIR